MGHRAESVPGGEGMMPSPQADKQAKLNTLFSEYQQVANPNDDPSQAVAGAAGMMGNAFLQRRAQQKQQDQMIGQRMKTLFNDMPTPAPAVPVLVQQ